MTPPAAQLPFDLFNTVHSPALPRSRLAEHVTAYGQGNRSPDAGRTENPVEELSVFVTGHAGSRLVARAGASPSHAPVSCAGASTRKGECKLRRTQRVAPSSSPPTARRRRMSHGARQVQEPAVRDLGMGQRSRPER